MPIFKKCCCTVISGCVETGSSPLTDYPSYYSYSLLDMDIATECQSYQYHPWYPSGYSVTSELPGGGDHAQYITGQTKNIEGYMTLSAASGVNPPPKWTNSSFQSFSSNPITIKSQGDITEVTGPYVAGCASAASGYESLGYSAYNYSNYLDYLNIALFPNDNGTHMLLLVYAGSTADYIQETNSTNASIVFSGSLSSSTTNGLYNRQLTFTNQILSSPSWVSGSRAPGLLYGGRAIVRPCPDRCNTTGRYATRWNCELPYECPAVDAVDIEVDSLEFCDGLCFDAVKYLSSFTVGSGYVPESQLQSSIDGFSTTLQVSGALVDSYNGTDYACTGSPILSEHKDITAQVYTTNHRTNDGYIRDLNLTIYADSSPIFYGRKVLENCGDYIDTHNFTSLLTKCLQCYSEISDMYPDHSSFPALDSNLVDHCASGTIPFPGEGQYYHQYDSELIRLPFINNLGRNGSASVTIAQCPTNMSVLISDCSLSGLYTITRSGSNIGRNETWADSDESIVIQLQYDSSPGGFGWYFYIDDGSETKESNFFPTTGLKTDAGCPPVGTWYGNGHCTSGFLSLSAL